MNAIQSAKDSFYVALRERLTALNPQRTINLAGQDVPAILVEENESPVAIGSTTAGVATSAGAGRNRLGTGSGVGTGLCPVPPMPDCFYLRFGAIHSLNPQSNAVAPFALDCSIAYCTRGTRDDATDRGRTLSALDSELLAITDPPRTGHCDFTETPPAALGMPVFWTAPQLAAVESVGAELRRSAQFTIFFYAQEDASA